MFFQTPWAYTTLIFAIAISLISVGLLLIYRKHQNWNYRSPILICWLLMVFGEIGKQIYYHGMLYRWPINFCGSFLLLVPLYLLSYKLKWKKVNEITTACTYVGTFAIFVVFLLYPKLLVGTMPSSGIFWDDYQDFWGVLYHTFVSFIALWFLFHHTLKLKWIHLLYIEILCVLLVIVMGTLSYYTDNNFGQIAKDVLPLSIGLHILVMGLIYCVGGGLSYIIWKYPIQKYLPDLWRFRKRH